MVETAVAGETVEAAEASSEDRNFVGDSVGDEGGVILGSETVILGAGLSWYDASGPFSGKPLRRRVAPIGTWSSAKESIRCITKSDGRIYKNICPCKSINARY